MAEGGQRMLPPLPNLLPPWARMLPPYAKQVTTKDAHKPLSVSGHRLVQCD